MHIDCPTCQKQIAFDNGSVPERIACPHCSRVFASSGLETLIVDPETDGETVTFVPVQAGNLESAPANAIGDYEILEEIARGGMGVVYKARQRSLDRIVALKLILGGQLVSDEQIQRFETEAKSAGKLDHPGIVAVYEVGQHDGQHFMSMAFVDGDSLLGRVKDHPLRPHDAADLIRKTAEAVQFAHDRNIVHRDLKPHNILIDHQGQPRITDFGLAKDFAVDSGMTATGQIMGTPSYMPPEQASGNPSTIGPLSDVYSLGATLYCLLVGRPPFQAASTIETIRQVADQEPATLRSLNPSVPRDLETICLKCLSKQPNRRYSSAAELAADLGRWMDRKPIVARRVSHLERALLWCRRRPALVGSIVAAIVAIAFVSYSLHLRRNEAEAARIVEGLVDAETAQVPDILKRLEPYRDWARDDLQATLSNAPKESNAWLHTAVAALQDHESLLPSLKDRLLDAEPEQLRTMYPLLQPYRQRLVDDLWLIAEDEDQSSRLLQAASGLAVYDAENERQWSRIADRLAEALLAEGALRAADWTRLLYSARRHLMQPLIAVFRNTTENRSQSEIDLATGVLEYYAADDVATLAELILGAEPQQLVALFDEFESHGPAALALIEKELDREAMPDWQDEALDPSWKKPSTSVQRIIENADGMIAEGFALCPTLKLADFEHVAEELRASGYRPIRLRPYAHNGDVQVAAAWQRDGRNWCFSVGLTVDSVQEIDEQKRGKGFVAVDVAGYLNKIDGDSAEHYAVLWMEQQAPCEDARIYAGVPKDKIAETRELLNAEGRRLHQSLQAFCGLDGRQKFSAVLTKATKARVSGGMQLGQSVADYDRQPVFDWIAGDVDYSASARLEELLNSFEKPLTESSADWWGLLNRAETLAEQGRHEEALEDVSRVLELQPLCIPAIRLRYLVYLARDQKQQAADDLERLKSLRLGAFEQQFLASLAGDQLEVDVKQFEAKPVSPVDLQRHIDPARHGVEGEWTLASGILSSPERNVSKLEFPSIPAVPYKFRLTLVPAPPAEGVPHTAMVVGLVHGNKVFRISFPGKQGVRVPLQNNEYFQGSETFVLQRDAISELEFEVLADGVRVLGNGVEILNWRGDFAELADKPFWETPRNCLSLGLYEWRMRVLAAVIEPENEEEQSLHVLDNDAIALRLAQAAKWSAISGRTEMADQLYDACAQQLMDRPELLVGCNSTPLLAPAIQRIFTSNSEIFRKAASGFARVSGLWHDSIDTEAHVIHGLAPDVHLAECRRLAAKGYRPVSQSASSIFGKLFTSSVWQRPLNRDQKKEVLAWRQANAAFVAERRPLITDQTTEMLARRKANAAIAALRMGAADRVWPLLQHSEDPSLRTWIIHRLSPSGIDASAISAQLRVESDVSVRRALILSLGEFTEADVTEQEALSGLLLDWYRDDPDPGIHGATGWLLRRWGQEDELSRIDAQLAMDGGGGERRWYRTKQGHTMVLLPGPVEFTMGSPPSEHNRNEAENLHRRRIERSFAIGATEVTVAQFEEFVRDAPEWSQSFPQQRYAPEPDCPRHYVSWYNAAAYCRWLSEQEGIPEDQMCYPPIADIKDGMTLPSDHLSRTGYRLPTESEWKYSCRAGTETAWCFGQSADLLNEYAWIQSTSQDRTWPVARLKPNDLGLFDMHGNLMEWCQERFANYAERTGRTTVDSEDTARVEATSSRTIGGGAFNRSSSDSRSANRVSNVARFVYSYVGFRLARTYYPSP